MLLLLLSVVHSSHIKRSSLFDFANPPWLELVDLRGPVVVTGNVVLWVQFLLGASI